MHLNRLHEITQMKRRRQCLALIFQSLIILIRNNITVNQTVQGPIKPLLSLFIPHPTEDYLQVRHIQTADESLKLKPGTTGTIIIHVEW